MHGGEVFALLLGLEHVVAVIETSLMRHTFSAVTLVCTQWTICHRCTGKQHNTCAHSEEQMLGLR